MTETTVATSSEVFETTHDAWLADHPDPPPLAFRCRYCRTEAGEPCSGKPRYWQLCDPPDYPKSHADRIDRMNA